MTHDDEIEERGLTRSEPAELELLGVLFRYPKVIATICAHLPLDAIYSERHKTILGTIYGLHAKGDIPDLVTVAEHLRRRNLMDVAGGDVYLMNLCEYGISAASALQYVEIILEHWICRLGTQWARDLNEACVTPPQSVQTMIKAAKAALDGLFEAERRLCEVRDAIQKRRLEAEGVAP